MTRQLEGAEADAWGVPDGTSADVLPVTYQEWVQEGLELPVTTYQQVCEWAADDE